MRRMSDRLPQLLDENPVLYGIIARDATPIDIELFAQAGYHAIWLDAEHAPLNPAELAQTCRSVLHLGMVPFVRIVELNRTNVQILLDAGAGNLILPDVRTAAQAAELVRLGKFPPVGARGVSSTSAAFDYAIGNDVEQTLEQANRSTHLMVQVESDEGLANLEAICALEEIDMVTVGPADWPIGLGLHGPGKEPAMAKKIDAVLAQAQSAGMITADPKQAGDYIRRGVRILFAGVDIGLKRGVYAAAISSLRMITS
jgi:4-hydroxy-2-oxoheptanedioate aldolase